MENREVTNKEALLNKALEAEFSDGARCNTLRVVAQDYLRDKLFYLGCAKIYEEAGDDGLAGVYRRHADWVDETYLNPLTEILGGIKLDPWNMEEKDIEEIRKYFGDEYFDFEEEGDQEWEIEE